MESIAPPAASQRRIAMVEVNMWPSMTAAERYPAPVRSSMYDRSLARSVVEQNLRHDSAGIGDEGKEPHPGDGGATRRPDGFLGAGHAVGS